MRTLLILGLVATLSGCAVAPDRAGIAGGGMERRVLNIPELGAGIFNCDGPGAASQHNGYPKCSEIPVIILETGSGCASLLPYNQLKVHVGPRKDMAEVTWVLLAPDGYRFDANTQGIWFKTPGNTYVLPRDVSTGSKQMYRWTVAAQAAYDTVSDHEARVIGPTGKPCTPIDPKIVNAS